MGTIPCIRTVPKSFKYYERQKLCCLKDSMENFLLGISGFAIRYICPEYKGLRPMGFPVLAITRLLLQDLLFLSELNRNAIN